MPRKSAAAKLLAPLLAERSRLSPPSGLSTRERQLFREVVGSVKPEHFCAEDVPLIALYAKGLAQCELATREIASGSTDKFWLELQAIGLKTVDLMTRKLRLSPLSRSPHNQRRPTGTTDRGLPLPWESNRMLRTVPDTSGASERNFSDLLRARARSRASTASLAATEALDELRITGGANEKV